MDIREQPLALIAGNAHPEQAPSVEAAFQKYAGRVYGLVRRFLDNDADAEDVTQQVFVQLLRKRKKFGGKSAFSTWLNRVAVNEALKFRQRRARRAEALQRLAGAAHGHAPQPAGEGPGPLRALMEGEAHALIERAAARLPGPWREAFVLADQEGLPVPEIAELLGLHVSTVKSRLHRARLKLRRTLAPYFADWALGVPRRPLAEAGAFVRRRTA